MSIFEAERLVRKYGILPNRLLGQSFMVDSSVFPLLGKYASLDGDDEVLEIGAGFGFLTRFLSERCGFVIAVERDEKVALALREQTEGLFNVKILEGDILEIDVPFFNKVVSIPPYQISSRLLLWLFDKFFEKAVFIFQEEFAQRVSARVGTDEYSWLTVLSSFNATIQIFDNVPRSSFFPQPNVDSTIIQFKKKAQPYLGINNPEVFRQMIRCLFTNRNRKVSNAIVPFLKSFLHLSGEESKNVILSLPFRDDRVRTLKPEDFGEIENALKF